MFNFNNVTVINILTWVIFGLLVGYVAHLLDPGDVKGGIFSTILTGIVGAMIGGFLANLIFGLNIAGFNLQSFLVALAGAFILAVLHRLFFRESHHIKTTTE